MTAACLAAKASPLYPRGESRMAWVGQLVLQMAVGAGVYLGVCHLLGMRALEHVLPRLRRGGGGGRGAAGEPPGNAAG